MARYDIEDGAGFTANHAVVPALVNAPVIFLAPKQRTASSGELWIAASSPDHDYGGCVVWLSNDTEHYYQIGVIDGRSHQGVLTAALPAGVGLDTANTLSVDLALSGSILESVSTATADRLDSLCYVGGELLAFRDATLTGLHGYDLSYLHRGVYNTDTGATINAPFVLLSGPMLRYRFNKNAVGGALHFKFQGFNIYGGGVQDLADCIAYSYNVTDDGGIKALLSDIAAPDWANVVGKPTTLAGYGITDAVSVDDLQAAIDTLPPSTASGLSIALNRRWKGDIPLTVFTSLLPAGAYSNCSVLFGCNFLDATAHLDVTLQDGTVLATVSHTGLPDAPTAFPSFTLASTALVDFKVRGGTAYTTTYIFNLTVA